MTDDTTFTSSHALLWHLYQNVDLKIGRSLCDCCNLDLLVVMRWFDITRKRISIVDGDQPGVGLAHGSFVQKAEFEGFALGLGFAGETCVWDRFGMAGHLTLLAAIGQQRTPIFREITNFDSAGNIVDIDVTVRPVTGVAPAIDYRLGMTYTDDCTCIAVIGEVGYGGHYYWKALRYNTQSKQVTSRSRTVEDIGFAGPYIRLGVLF